MPISFTTRRLPKLLVTKKNPMAYALLQHLKCEFFTWSCALQVLKITRTQFSSADHFMTTPWTTEQVTAMAPDAASVAAGRKLGSVNKWKTLGQSNDVLWGECQGSGSNPYQTCIEQSEPAFKCSCPSRKFPCKHALGLAFIFAEHSNALSAGEPPSWVNEWLQKREQTVAKKAAKAAAAEQPLDPAAQQRRDKAQQKRTASREEKIKAGIEELQRWLQDLVRRGLAQQSDHPDPWAKMAARMIDAQAPGLARWLQRTGDLRYQLAHWQDPMLTQIAKLHTLLSAFQRKADLSPDVQADINALIGYTQNKDEVLAQDGVSDNWWVLSQRSDLESQLQMQRTWLWGQHSKRYALVIDFAAANQVLPVRPNVGRGFLGELVFYPGNWPVRALLKATVETAVKTSNENLRQHATSISPAFANIPSALQHYSNVLANYPWVDDFPMGLSKVTPLRDGDQWLLLDEENRLLPMAVSAYTGWALLAISGGNAVNVFGEWDGGLYRPLSVFDNATAHNLTAVNFELAG